MPPIVVRRWALAYLFLYLGCGSDPAAPATPDAPAGMPHSLAVTIYGNGTMVREDTGQRCRGGCNWSFMDTPVLHLSATPDPGWQLEGWTGRCQSHDADIMVVVDRPLSCELHFSALPVDAAEDAPDLPDAGTD